jgi:hypothetical protein
MRINLQKGLKFSGEKEVMNIFPLKVDNFINFEITGSKNSVKRRQIFLRESDKFFKNKMHLNQTSNEYGDTILQANFGVSKPKPWRKDDEVSIRNNARAEIVVNPDKIETQPKGKGAKQEPQKDSYFKRRKKFQIGGRISGLFSGDEEETKISMPNCGQSSVTNKRIVNGKNARHGAYPWIVVVLKQGDAWCAGSIIKEDWILTAAHCFMGCVFFDYFYL